MSSEELHVVAILSPSPGSLDRLTTLLKTAIKQVHATEPHTLRYLMCQADDESTASDTPDIIMIEKYRSKEHNLEHTQTPHFRELFAAFQEEKLLSKEPYLARMKAIGGFDLERELVG